MQLINNIVFPTWACAAGFNNIKSNDTCQIIFWELAVIDRSTSRLQLHG